MISARDELAVTELHMTLYSDFISFISDIQMVNTSLSTSSLFKC